LAERSDDQDPAALDVVRRFIMGFRTTQLVHVAAKLGIADLLQDGPKDASTLAAATGAHPRALYRVLRALSSLGIFAETTDGRFELTPLGQTLRRGVPGSLRDVALLYGDEWLWRAYGRLSHSVITGKPGFDDAHGQTFYQYLHDQPEAAAAFDRTMTAFSEQEAARLVIVERVVPEDNEPSEAKLFDINMLVVPGGLERTAAEYEKILGEAGFDLIRVIPTTSSVSVIESTPAATSM
jgi:hypothetical protein